MVYLVLVVVLVCPSNMKAFRWAALTVGTLFGVAHIGILGHLISKDDLPVINLPVGDYTSYSVDATRDGYSINYNSNDPKVMGVRKNINKNNGFFGIGGNSVVVTEEEYTMDGGRHLQGGDLGKLTAKNLECLKSEGAGESTGGIVGASMTAGLAPVLSSIPYVGWLAAGWATLLGQNVGSELGGEIATSFNDC